MFVKRTRSGIKTDKMLDKVIIFLKKLFYYIIGLFLIPVNLRVIKSPDAEKVGFVKLSDFV